MFNAVSYPVTQGVTSGREAPVIDISNLLIYNLSCNVASLHV